MGKQKKELTAKQQRGKKIAEIGVGGLALGIIVGLLGISGSLSDILTYAGLAVALLYFCLSLRHDLSTIRQMPERTVVFDAFGRELGTLHAHHTGQGPVSP